MFKIEKFDFKNKFPTIYKKNGYKESFQLPVSFLLGTENERCCWRKNKKSLR
jgi:hypothetical protein